LTHPKKPSQASLFGEHPLHSIGAALAHWAGIKSLRVFDTEALNGKGCSTTGVYNARFIWWSAEDSAWDRMAPVGREFGSPDYARLMKEDAETWQAKLSPVAPGYSA
jgi:hypothetical protein